MWNSWTDLPFPLGAQKQTREGTFSPFFPVSRHLMLTGVLDLSQ